MSNYTDRVEKNLEGLKFVSTGICPGCKECMSNFDFDDAEAFREAWSNGTVFSEGHFSWGGCGICDSRLGGTMEEWHAVDENGELLHFDDACQDCVVYLANGDEPEPDPHEHDGCSECIADNYPIG